MELSILMPCLNEAETLEVCIHKAQSFLITHGIEGEVIIADNGSTDGSADLASSLGARVVQIPDKGYGEALKGGIQAAKGKYIIMGDADDSYDFSALMPFVEQLRAGKELVMGNRFKGGIKKGAMPFLHRYLGNPVLSFIGRLFFGSSIGDFHCGLRGFSAEKIKSLSLVSAGMEFASEMVVKATIFKLNIAEVPIILYPDGRSRKPHLRTWRDGWRHLVFLLMYSPRWLFFYPGISLLIFGVFGLSIIYSGTVNIDRLNFDVHTMAVAGLLVNVGLQLLFFSIFIRIFAIVNGLFPPKKRH